MRKIIALIALATAIPVSAQTFSGPAAAIDGDTLAMAGERIRLHGIDAPEGAQTCDRKGAIWACGTDARALLTQLVSGRIVECTQRDRDDYGRIVASCRAGASDLGNVMVREGLAIALTRFSQDYVEAEARAKSFGMALWGSKFQTPAEFRAANPALFAARAPRSPAGVPIRSAAPRTAAVASFSFSFRNCAAARAAGAAPLRRGQPGYGIHMDGDGDGIACEPYRR